MQKVVDLGSQPWGNNFVRIADYNPVPRYPLELYLCLDCSMAQINYTIPKEVMFVDHHYVSGTTRSLRTHFERVAEQIFRKVSFEPSDYVLDVGGNDGTFLRCIKDRGIDVLNVDSAVHQAALSVQNGIPCINKFFNLTTAQEIREKFGPAKVIHGSGVFFHLEELHSAFAGVKQLLADGGTVVAEFIYLPEMMKRCAFDQIYHEHLLYYTLTSLNRLLGYHKLKIFDAQQVSIHGGSCIAWITHRDDAQETDAVREMLAIEKSAKLEDPTTYYAFAKRAEAVRDQLVALVRGLRASQKRIQALGAPVKGSTIVNYCGFTEADLECAVEINDLKTDTYIPGTKIPVYHQDHVAPPDIYLLLAWNFRDEILAKMENFRKKGGKIIVPIPEPEIV